MRSYLSIISLLVSTLFMAVANGLLGTLVPLTARAWQFYPSELGAVSSAYFAGMLVGALIAPWLVRRVGHIRALAGCMALAAIATLLQIMWVHVWPWIALRFITGFAFAGLYAAIESWLQGKADDSIRGRIFAVYSVLQYAGWAVGNQTLGLAAPTDYHLYSLAAAALCAAIMPLALTTSAPPAPPDSPRLDLIGILRHSPIGFVGAIAIGLANGPHWTLIPVFNSDIGLTVAQVGTFATFLTLGSAAFQIPVGRLSDAIDRRRVLLGLLLASAIVEVGMALGGAKLAVSALYATGFVLGGLVATQYYVTAAHTNDRSSASQAVQISASLLLLYCIGAVIGPLSAAEMMRLIGPGGLFWHNAIIHVALAGFVAYRIMKKSAPPRAPEDPDARQQPLR
jgi:MFS family permease